jgi:hypothetical protein
VFWVKDGLAFRFGKGGKSSFSPESGSEFKKGVRVCVFVTVAKEGFFNCKLFLMIWAIFCC